MLPPPICTEPVESVAELDPPATASGVVADAFPNGSEAAMSAAIIAAPAWTASNDRVASLPPSCTVPVEFDALFPPLPPTLAGALT